ncbi:MAG: thiamine ABC transporter ATP-binding protein [Mesorhizobium sp.]
MNEHLQSGGLADSVPNGTPGGAPVRLDKVAFGYGEAEFFFDADFAAGEITAVMGPSGSGKSTLLNLVAGFEVPRAGRVLIGGADVTAAPPSARPVSMVFQENNLFAHLTVADNVGLGRSPSLKLTHDDRGAVAEALARTGLAGKERRLPRELSGGERQRVALARALVRDRPVLLLDEPFASLGPALRDDMLDLLDGVQAERRMTVLFVTHQPQDARRIAHRVVFLEEGRVAASGSAGDFFAGTGPAAFRRYIGADDGGSRDIARKRT